MTDAQPTEPIDAPDSPAPIARGDRVRVVSVPIAGDPDRYIGLAGTIEQIVYSRNRDRLNELAAPAAYYRVRLDDGRITPYLDGANLERA